MTAFPVLMLLRHPSVPARLTKEALPIIHRKKVNRDSLPASVLESSSSVQGKATGDESTAP